MIHCGKPHHISHNAYYAHHKGRCPKHHISVVEIEFFHFYSLKSFSQKYKKKVFNLVKIVKIFLSSINLIKSNSQQDIVGES